MDGLKNTRKNWHQFHKKKSTSCGSHRLRKSEVYYMLLEFSKAEKQMAAKPIVDYFQRVCDATLMHEWSHRGTL